MSHSMAEEVGVVMVEVLWSTLAFFSFGSDFE